MPDALRRIEERVRRHAGLRLPAWVLAARVEDRVSELALPDARAYLGVLDGPRGTHELGVLTEKLRVGETRFFRHDAHIGALRRIVLPELCARRAARRRIRAWSAGCASGEEAYTLALLLGEAAPGFTLDVLATDLSEAALAMAREGVYPEEDLADVPGELRRRAFVPAGSGRVQVTRELAGSVRFERHNLRTGGFPEGLDIVLCRNVLIYFDDEARRATVERLIGSLAPGGYLFLGYAESLRGFPQLEGQRSADGVIYRKRAQAAPPPPRPVAPVRRLTPPAVLAPHVARGEGRLAISGPLERADALAAALSRALAEAGPRLVVELDGAGYLADELAAVLRRAVAAAAADQRVLELSASRPGPRRWLARHGLLP